MQIRDARLEDADQLARITLEARRVILTGLVPESVIAGFTHEESARNWRGTLRGLASTVDPDEFLFIAQTTEGLPVGLVMGGPAREQDPVYRGEVYILSVDDAHRRQGYGRLLVAYAAGRLAQTGLRPFLIRVLRENAPACRFYEALGGELLPDTREIDEDGVLLEEVAYGWRSWPRAASASP
jgi:ribosomal protein S18 acetylase RimI-like enzyme